jgi:acetolactate synthase-1/3 small subunit
VFRLTEIFRAKVLDISPASFTLALTGDQDKLKAFIDLLAPAGIIDYVRTGTIVMEREMQAKRRTDQ